MNPTDARSSGEASFFVPYFLSDFDRRSSFEHILLLAAFKILRAFGPIDSVSNFQKLTIFRNIDNSFACSIFSVGFAAGRWRSS